MIYGIAIFPERHVQDFANSFRKRYDPRYTLIPPHITLKEAFEIPDEPTREEIVEKIEAIAEQFPPFTLKITKVSTFYPASNTIYLAIEEKPELRRLHEKLHEGILKPESPQAFIPHVTIGQKMSAEELQDVYGQLRMRKIEMETKVDRFHLLYCLEDGVWTVYQTFLLGKRDRMTTIRKAGEKDRTQVFAVRRKVFVEEQGVPEEIEIDRWDQDPRTIYLLAEEGRTAVGCLRLRPYREETGKIERVAVLSECRGRGIGRRLMARAEEEAKEAGYRTLYLHSQLHAASFYRNLGYAPVGEVFEEAGIPHIAMIKHLR